MTRPRRFALTLAGALIAVRLFVPVTECTLTNPFTRVSYSYHLPRFVPRNYGPPSAEFPPQTWAGEWRETRVGNYIMTIPKVKRSPAIRLDPENLEPGQFEGSEDLFFEFKGGRWVDNFSGTEVPLNIPGYAEGSTASWWPERNRWSASPPPKPDLWTRVRTLDPGGYWQTACDKNWAPHTLFGVTLLHVLGIATIAGVIFVILPQPRKL